MPAKKKSRKQVEGYPPRKAGRVSESHYLFRRMRAGEPAAESGFVKTAAGETEGDLPPELGPRILRVRPAYS